MVKYVGKEVGPIGFGLMSLTWNSNISIDDAVECMKTALEAGANVWNGGEFYGTPEHNSMHVVKAYFTKYPEDADRVILNVKGCVPGAGTPAIRPDSSEAGIRRSVDFCLDILAGTKKIDVFEPARRDHTVPLEQVMGTLKALVDEEKIGAIGLSEVGAETISEAAKYAPISGGVEVEFSMWFTDILENGVAKACAELDIPVIAYTPLTILQTGQIKSFDDIPEGDVRRHFPRFQPDVFDTNLRLVNFVRDLAERKSCTPAQIAIAWVCAMSGKPGLPTIIPIPGSKSVARVKENSTLVELTEGEMEEVAVMLREFESKGERFPGRMNQLNWG